MQTRFLITLAGCLLCCIVPMEAEATFQPSQTGTRARYQISYQGEGTVNVKALLSQNAACPDRIQSSLRAQMEVVQIAPSIVAVRLLSPEHRFVYNGEAQNLAQAISTLREPCYLTVDRQGSIQTLSFPIGTPPVARSLMRSLVSGLSFARPATKVLQWSQRQDTVNGLADVTYRALDKTTFEKRITAYPLLREIGVKGDLKMRHFPQGELRFTFAQARLQKVNGMFATRSTLAGKQMSEAKENFELVLTGQDRVMPAILASLNGDRRKRSHEEVPTALHIRDQDRAAQRASWVQALRGATPASLLADLKVLDTKQERNDSALYTRLCAMLSLEPGTAAYLQREMANASFDKTSTRLVIAALSGVASAPQSAPGIAQAAEVALREMLMARHNQPEAVVILAPALGMTHSPHPETWQLLQTLSQSKDRDTAISSTLAVGSMAPHCPAPDRKRLVSTLIKRFASSEDSMREHLLAALGNAGAVEGLDILAACTRHSSAVIRSVACMSLRFIPGSRVNELLFHCLKDADAGVRLSVARALQFRPFSVEDVLMVQRAIQQEPSVQVRLTLLENLQLEADYHPQARHILQLASAKDTSPEVRKAVTEWLQQ